jgi:hypothetical protein
VKRIARGVPWLKVPYQYEITPVTRTGKPLYNFVSEFLYLRFYLAGRGAALVERLQKWMSDWQLSAAIRWVGRL